jgi:hypothetical protein
MGASAPAGSSARKPSVDKPSAAKPKLTDKDRKKLVIGVACLVVGLCVLSVYGYFNWIKKPRYLEPPLIGDALSVAKFVGTPTYDALEFDRQLIWMDTVGDKKKEIEELFKAGKVTEEQYKDVKAISWLGKRFRRIQTYHDLPEIQRKAYLDKIIADEIADDELDKKREQEDGKLPGRDKEKVKLLVSKFPERQRQEYDGFKKALGDREDYHKKQAKEAKKAAEAATRPTTRPTERQ